jgi:signal transduction histidine kinase
MIFMLFLNPTLIVRIMKAAIPVNENLRLADLYQYDILDTPAEQQFDDLVTMASRICNAPVSMISLIDAERQWLKASVGRDCNETSRDISFSSHGILNDHIFIVPDATKDERFTDNPMVTGTPGIRFYAGVPLTSQAGNNLGMLCVKNTVPGNLTNEQQEALIILGKQVVKQMELRLKSKELERISNAHRRIISIISHDVRSPLSSVVSLLNMYQNRVIDPARFTDFLQVAGAQLHCTLTLLENLVEWGRIQLQQPALVSETLLLKDEVFKAFNELAGQANLKDNKLINEVDDSILISLDENIIRFILRNLLTNANKFTGHGEITVEGFNQDNKTIIRISDTGIGMPQSMCERLFASKEKFSRRGTQNESGSGLGLVLIKEFIDKAHGSIKVISTEGHGSCFIIELPL